MKQFKQIRTRNVVSFVLQSRIINSLRVVHVIRINKGFFPQIYIYIIKYVFFSFKKLISFISINYKLIKIRLNGRVVAILWKIM